MRSRYDSAIDQLGKGKRMFENILRPVADISDDWHYIGFVAFPEIENRNELNKYLKLTEDGMKVT